MLYAADIRHGGPADRVFCSLEDPQPPEALWWLSIDGIYRERAQAGDAALRLLPELCAADKDTEVETSDELLHPKYQLPARCFGYVGDHCDRGHGPCHISTQTAVLTSDDYPRPYRQSSATTGARMSQASPRTPSQTCCGD